MQARQENGRSFYAAAISSSEEMRHAIGVTTREFSFHEMNDRYVDFVGLDRVSPDWLRQNKFARIRAVSSLTGTLFWADFLNAIKYPQEDLVRQDLLGEVAEDYIDAGHEMRWRSDGFDNTPLMFAIAAATGKHAANFFLISSDYKGDPIQAAPAMPAVRAGRDFVHAAYHPVEYYERLLQLFPAEGIDIKKSAWRYLWDGKSFEESGIRCPGAGLTRVILAEFGKTVGTEEFKQRILTGK